VKQEILHGSESFFALKNNTYRFNFLEGTGDRKAHFSLCESLVKNTVIKRIFRPEKHFVLDELVECVLKDMTGGNDRIDC
jgi:hypothetical protein